MTTITSKFTKERLIDWAVVAVAERVRDLKDAPESVEAAANLKLAEIALASLTAEPVRYLNKFSGTCVTLEQQPNAADDVAVYIPLYAAPPVQETGVYQDMLNIIGLLENNEWAEHCTSTVLGSLLESEITRLVGKEQSVPVVPEEMPKGLAGQIVSLLAHNIDDKFLAQKIWNACRAAMLQAGNHTEQHLEMVDHSGDANEKGKNGTFIDEGTKQAGNSPVVPDGYALVPVEPTDEMIAAAMECDDVVFDSKDPTVFCVQFREIYCAMVDAAPKPEGNNG